MSIFHNAFKTIGILAIATLLGSWFTIYTGSQQNTAIIYILAVIIISRMTSGYLFGITASVAAVIGINYFFTYPYMSIDFTRQGYPLTFLGMLAISILTSTMTARMVSERNLVLEREQVMNRLNDANRLLMLADSQEQVISITDSQLSKFTENSAAIYQKEEQGILSLHTCLVDKMDEDIFKHIEAKDAVLKVYEKKKETDLHGLFPQIGRLYLFPLTAHDKVLAVAAIYQPSPKEISYSIQTFSSLLAAQSSMALARQVLEREHYDLKLDTEIEKTKANLLRAVSHDLRTPLTGMIGASSTYIENKSYLSEKEKDALILHINEDSNWLLRMVENLLTVTRINQKDATVSKTPEPLEEIVSDAVSRLKKQYPNIWLEVKIPSDFIMVPVDAMLIEQVIINLLENAVKYSKSESPLLLSVTNSNDWVTFSVVDHGIGLSKEQIDHIFDGSSKSPSSDSAGGMGIGLSICKTIVHAHGGILSAKNHPNGGAVFTFTLPLEGDDFDE